MPLTDFHGSTSLRVGVYVYGDNHGLSNAGASSFKVSSDLMLPSLENSPVNASTMELRLELFDLILHMLFLRSRGSLGGIFRSSSSAATI